jgi:hypothetical protein
LLCSSPPAQDFLRILGDAELDPTITEVLGLDRESVGSSGSGNVYPGIVVNRVVVIVCAREGDSLGERPRLETADEDLEQDG